MVVITIYARNYMEKVSVYLSQKNGANASTDPL